MSFESRLFHHSFVKPNPLADADEHKYYSHSQTTPRLLTRIPFLYPMNHTHYLHSHTDTQTIPILTQTTPMLTQTFPILTQVIHSRPLRHTVFSPSHLETHTTTIFTLTYRKHLCSLRHTDYTYCLCLLKTYRLYSHYHTDKQTTPIPTLTNRLLPFSHRHKDYSYSHRVKQTTPILRLLPNSFLFCILTYYKAHPHPHYERVKLQ